MKSKNNVILDLDNTIICAVEKHNYNKTKFELLDNNLTYKDMDSYYRIYARPGLDKFIDYLFENFEVSVFTAASKSYALFIVDNFILKGKTNRELKYMFHSYHTTISESKYNYIKDLRLLWSTLPSSYNPNNTIIIDDLKQVKTANQQNCLNVKAFEVFDEKRNKIIPSAIKDDELERILPILRMYQ